MKPTLLFFISALFYSCTGTDKQPVIDSTKIDSIATVKRLSDMAKKYNAVNFHDFYHNKFSVEFDSILNKRVFLDRYKVKDVKSDSPNFIVVLKYRDRFLINIKAKHSDISTLNKMITGDAPTIVISLSDIKRANVTSDDILFFGNGTLEK